MNNVQIIADSSEMSAIIKSREARNTIGKAISRAYPHHPWLVQMSDDGTVAQVTCPAITTEYGMVLHVHQLNDALERKAVRMAGELLERFSVSRTQADFSHILRDRRGGALGAAKGEQ
jgi:hypothetical protein